MRSFFKQLNLYGFERTSKEYPVYYYHPQFEKGKYSEVVHINRKIDQMNTVSSEKVEIDKLEEEFIKMRSKYLEMYDNMIQFREQITQNIEQNKALLLDQIRYRREFCSNTKKFILYFNVKARYIDSLASNETAALLRAEQPVFDPEEKIDGAKVCTNLTPSIVASLKKVIFFTYPMSNLHKKCLDIVLDAMQRKIVKGENPEWAKKMRNYLIYGIQDDDIISLEGYEQMEEVRLSSEEQFRMIFNNYDMLIDKFHESEDQIATNYELGRTEHISRISERDRFSVRSLQNMLIFNESDIALSSTPTLY